MRDRILRCCRGSRSDALSLRSLASTQPSRAPGEAERVRTARSTRPRSGLHAAARGLSTTCTGRGMISLKRRSPACSARRNQSAEVAMRVIAGQRQGAAARRRCADGSCGRRPTASRRRCSASCGSRIDLDGAAVLDLFAGSGALGIEALSRGRRAAMFRRAGTGGAAGSGRQPRALRARRARPGHQPVGPARRWRDWPARGEQLRRRPDGPALRQGPGRRRRWGCSPERAWLQPGRLGGRRAPRRRRPGRRLREPPVDRGDAAMGRQALALYLRREQSGRRGGDVKRKAVYAGSFDPITKGHLDIVRRALGVFDRDRRRRRLQSRPRTRRLFTAVERVAMIRDALTDLADRVEVDAFDGSAGGLLRSHRRTRHHPRPARRVRL